MRRTKSRLNCLFPKSHLFLELLLARGNTYNQKIYLYIINQLKSVDMWKGSNKRKREEKEEEKKQRRERRRKETEKRTKKKRNTRSFIISNKKEERGKEGAYRGERLIRKMVCLCAH